MSNQHCAKGLDCGILGNHTHPDALGVQRGIAVGKPNVATPTPVPSEVAETTAGEREDYGPTEYVEEEHDCDGSDEHPLPCWPACTTRSASAEPDAGSIGALVKVLAQHAGCVANDSRSTGWADGSGVTGVDVWSCGIRVPFVDDLEDMERAHLAHALAAHADGVRPDALGRIDERIERLWEVAYRWDVPGGSRRLAQRARDKVAGLELARRLVARESR